MDYVPNPIIIARAVELWKRELRAPTYQNELPGQETNGGMASMLATIAPRNSTPDVLDAFGEALTELLMQPRKHGYESYLAVDYNPDETLAKAAERAGLKTKFPWKTTMDLRTGWLAFKVGYGARSMLHYPLSRNRWLITDLRGDDMAKIIALVEAGVDLGLAIEE